MPVPETARQTPRNITADNFQGIERFEADLWEIADNLRANSNLASNEYCMPIMGLIFLRHATNRYYQAKAAIEADKAAGKMPDRPLVEADFTRRRELNLPESARFDVILKTPKSVLDLKVNRLFQCVMLEKCRLWAVGVKYRAGTDERPIGRPPMRRPGRDTTMAAGGESRMADLGHRFGLGARNGREGA